MTIWLMPVIRRMFLLFKVLAGKELEIGGDLKG